MPKVGFMHSNLLFPTSVNAQNPTVDSSIIPNKQRRANMRTSLPNKQVDFTYRAYRLLEAKLQRKTQPTKF